MVPAPSASSDPSRCLDLARPWLSERLVAWPVLPSAFLGPEQARGVKAFGLPLLLVRSAAGRAVAFLDRCPHRHVSFFCSDSPPQVQGDVVTCPYHEQSFDGSGRCVRSIHDEHPPEEHLQPLSLFEAEGFLWMPVRAAMFRPDGPLLCSGEEIEALRAGLTLPAEFVQLNGTGGAPAYDALELFSFLYAEGPWQIVVSSAIDHTHGFQVHRIARVVHRLRRWLGQETLSGMHMVCDDAERSVLVTYQQYAESLEAYWKVGGAPNLWLNKLGDQLYISVIFVPETEASTRMYGVLHVGAEWRFLLENHPMMHQLRELSIANSLEDQPFIASQAAFLRPGQLPVGHASVNDAPVYHFFRYLEAITGEAVNFHAKPHVTDLLQPR